MKLDLTWGELARAAGGRLTRGEGGDPVQSFSTDTRALSAGQAFWALKGERFDAHDLLAKDAALARKADGWIVERGRLPESAPKPAHIVEVANTLRAMQALAAHHRRRFEIPIVGITGSNGKTTTKEMLKGICRRVGATCASPGNWNNQLGVPLSVLELLPEHRYGVFELADSHPGDIDEVSKVAQPTVGVITNLGADHLEFYGSMEANFKCKSELIENLPEDGKAVVNADDPWLAGLEPRLGARAVTFGLTPRARVHFEDDGALVVDRNRLSITLHTFGKLSRYNAAAAAAAAWALGIDLENIRQGLEDYRPSAMRLEVLRHATGCPIVLDAYNANPDSMRAAVEAFCAEYASAKKVLVLGDMKELGRDSKRFHAELGEWLASLPLAGVFLGGPEMKAAADALGAFKPAFPVRYAADAKDWTPELKKQLTAAHAAFFKASRAMAFESIVGAL
jgi:UDP-N-acetylmuramoyl-tripeptide--D-alanyl-D-alanine ligase